MEQVPPTPFQEIENALKPFTDPKGFIGHKHDQWGLEFGDGTQRTGTAAIAWYVLRSSAEDRGNFGVRLAAQLTAVSHTGVDSNGKLKIQYLRHWDNRYWPGQQWIMSRDNLDPIWIAAALYSPYHAFCKLHFEQISRTLFRRGYFTWNWRHIWPNQFDEPKIPDWYGFIWPMVMSIRGNRRWYFYPALLFLDLFIIGASLVRVIGALIDKNETGDDLNHQNKLVFCQLIYWTPVVFLARLIYKFRRRPDTEDKFAFLQGPLAAYHQYYSGPNNPPIYKLWADVVRKYV